MQTSNLRHQLHLYRYQVVLLVLCCFVSTSTLAQNTNKENLTDYENEWIHYGFHMGIHNSKYKIKYSDRYTSPELDSLHSVVPNNTAGWRVGFVVNMRLLEYLDVRILPTVGFYENSMTYRYIPSELNRDGLKIAETKDATTVELPILLKYKSVRRGNIAMYAVGGINPAMEVAGKGDDFDAKNNLQLKDFNLSVDAGIGFDLYFPLFKFSPEIRYTWGLRDMLPDNRQGLSAPFESLTYENFAVYITFEGGPSYLKYQRKKKRTSRRK